VGLIDGCLDLGGVWEEIGKVRGNSWC
jgi:hypothetical protein